MIRYMLHFYLICQLFVSKHAEPIIGEDVSPANPQDFTFVASLGFKNPNSFAQRIHLCGGSLITKSHVLTAAHCLRNVSMSKVDVMIGEVYLAATSPRYSVDGWITYDEWAMVQRRIQLPTDDIAIVKLQTPVNCSDIKPVLLTDLNNKQLFRRSAVMAGWGITNTGIAADSLLRARVTILTPEECSKKGDSGGPLLDQNNVLLGVVGGNSPRVNDEWGNFHEKFLNQYKVIVYASVDYYRDFIESYTGLRTR